MFNDPVKFYKFMLEPSERIAKLLFSLILVLTL